MCLKWATLLTNQTSINFYTDFDNFLFFENIIKYYIDPIKKEGVGENKGPKYLRKQYVKYGLNTINFKEIKNYNSFDILVFVMGLFSQAPLFQQNITKLNFSGKLNELITKQISINNPINRQVSFHVILKGSKDFRIESDLIQIPPKQTFILEINFKSITSIPSIAKLYLKNKKDGGIQFDPQIYKLSSKITQRDNCKVIELDKIKLYELCRNEVVIDNPFPKDAEFQI